MLALLLLVVLIPLGSDGIFRHRGLPWTIRNIDDALGETLAARKSEARHASAAQGSDEASPGTDRLHKSALTHKLPTTAHLIQDTASSSSTAQQVLALAHAYSRSHGLPANRSEPANLNFMLLAKPLTETPCAGLHTCGNIWRIWRRQAYLAPRCLGRHIHTLRRIERRRSRTAGSTVPQRAAQLTCI